MYHIIIIFFIIILIIIFLSYLLFLMMDINNTNNYNYDNNDYALIIKSNKLIYSNDNGKIELDYNINNNDNYNNDLNQLKIINKNSNNKIIEINNSNNMIMHICINRNSEIIVKNTMIIYNVYKNYLNKLITIKLYNSYNVNVIKNYKFNIKNYTLEIEINDDNIIN